MSKKPIYFEDDGPPEDLPEVTAKRAPADAVKASRICEKCSSTSVRINSTHEGRRAWCNQCGHNWGISMATSMHVRDGILSRGITKRTLVEPDWNLAFEDIGEWDDQQ